MNLSRKGKVVVITGGKFESDIAVANDSATESVDVILAARGCDQAEAERISHVYGARAHAVAWDAGTTTGTRTLINTTYLPYWRADFLINNTGTGNNKTVMETPEGKWLSYWSCTG